ncbi:MAG: serine/threonine-protein kinase [Chloroflexota bacterium]|nr:serine/threonine-protein kinase [Chloroflexota bacterium]
MLTCDTCGKLHPDGTPTCEVCGKGLAAWPYLANSDLGAELGLDRLAADSELGRVLAAPLRELSSANCRACGIANRPGATFCTHCGAVLNTATTGNLAKLVGALPPGTVLQSRYALVRRVAQGGMGAVYEAHDTRLAGRRLAIKEMAQAGIAPDERTQALKDFMREATLLATLDHPNLPQFGGIFSEDGKYYLIMEFVQGRTLEQTVGSSRGFLPESRVLSWAAQLCDVLNYLHKQQPPIIYRDMKPGNVMLLDNDDQIKLIDFGIARFHRRGRTSEAAAYGTAGYAPPEQYGTGQTDERSDVYALGATLHHLLSGHDPAQNPFHWKPLRAFNPHVSRRVDQAIMRALELKPELRFVSVDAFAQALGLRAVPAAVHHPATHHHHKPAAAPAPLPVPTVPPIAATADRLAPAPALTPSGPAERATILPLAAGAGSALPQAAGPQLALSETRLDLGVMGRQARRGRKINLLNTGVGQLTGIVHAGQPWLAVSAVQFQGNVGEVTVRGRARGLHYGHTEWPLPNLFSRTWQALHHIEGWVPMLAALALIAFGGMGVGWNALTAVLTAVWLLIAALAVSQAWLWTVARHVRWLVPAPLVNSGEVIVDSNGGRQQVAVQVLARPAPWRSILAWTVVSGLLVGELLALVVASLVLLHILVVY